LIAWSNQRIHPWHRSASHRQGQPQGNAQKENSAKPNPGCDQVNGILSYKSVGMGIALIFVPVAQKAP